MSGKPVTEDGRAQLPGAALPGCSVVWADEAPSPRWRWLGPQDWGIC